MRKKAAGLLAVLFAVGTALTGCAGGKLDNTAEVINVDGTSVPMGELNFLLRYQQTQIQAFYGTYFGEDFMNQDLMGTGEVYGVSMRDSAVETLEELYLLEAHAGELEVSLADEEKKAASDAAKAFLAANDSKALTAMSADEGTVTHVLELLTLQSKVTENLAGTIDTKVSDEEAAQKSISYVREPVDVQTDDEGDETEQDAEELAEKKRTLEEVLAAAKESKDLDAAAEAKGLTVDYASYGQSDDVLDETMKAEADKLSDGEFSGVIEGGDGYYIVYMESTFDEDATESEKENILEQRKEDAYNDWYEPLKEAAQISTDDNRIAKLTFERIFQMPADDSEDTEEDEAPDEENASEGTDTEEEQDAEAGQTE